MVKGQNEAADAAGAVPTTAAVAAATPAARIKVRREIIRSFMRFLTFCQQAVDFGKV